MHSIAAQSVAAGQDPTLFSSGILRLAAVPPDSLKQVKFEACTHLLDEWNLVLDYLENRQEPLSEQLHAEIGNQDDDEIRTELINARRSLYKFKLPSEAGLNSLGNLEPARRQAVRAFISAIRRYEAIPGELTTTLEAEYRQAAERLKLLYEHHPALLDAIEVASRNLVHTALKYLDDRAAPPSLTRYRKIENSLMIYLSRASVKTSPLSRFMHLQVVDFQQVDPAQAAPLHLDMRSEVHLSIAALLAIVRAMRANEELQELLRHRVNPDAFIKNGVLYSHKFSYGINFASQYLKTELESGLLNVANWLLSVRETFSNRRFHAQLAELGVTISEAGSQKLWCYLTESALLIPTLTIADDDPELLTTFAQQLDPVEGPLAQTLQADLQSLEHVLKDYGQTSGSFRRQQGTKARKIFNKLMSDLGAEVQLPSNRLVYENVFAAQRKRPASTEPFSVKDADVQALSRIASLYNTRTLTPILVQHFVGRYGYAGICDNAYAFVREALPDLRKAVGFKVDTKPKLGAQPDTRTQTYLNDMDSSSQRMATLRAELSSRLAELLSAETADVVTLAPETVLGLGGEQLDSFPFEHNPFASMTLFIQGVGEAAGDYVLNHVMAGHAALFQDMLKNAPQARAAVRSYLKQLYKPGIPAQLMVRSPSTINLAPLVTERVICTPGAASSHQNAYYLKDLRVLHNPSRASLEFLDKGDEVLVPLYLGKLSPTFLVPSDWLLSKMTPSVQFNPKYLSQEFAAQGAKDVQYTPALKVGRFLLLRQSWSMSAELDLRRSKAESELSYWRRIRRWLSLHDIPMQFYVHPDDSWVYTYMGLGGPSKTRGRVKPQFFDMDSFFMLRVFEKWTRDLYGLRWTIQAPLPHPFGSGEMSLEGREHTTERVYPFNPDYTSELGVELRLH